MSLSKRIRHADRGSRGDKILFTSAEARPGRVLAMRGLVVLGLFALVISVLWLDRSGISDQIDGDLSFIDLIYFVVVSLTTVGYGDIVPVTERARLIDAIIITPARVLVWLVFLGTAFEFFFHKGLERFRMARLQQRLQDHIVVCGFGHSGRTAASELVSRGTPIDQIVIVDIREDLLKDAAAGGYIGLRGDAAMERTLRSAAVERAAAVIVTTGRDDTNALVVLTIRQLNSRTRVITSSREAENVPLLRQAGADVTVSPSQISGYLLADSVAHRHVNEFVLDVLSSGGRLLMIERPPRDAEIGRQPGVIGDRMILRIYRQGRPIGFWEGDAAQIRAGDTLLVLEIQAVAAASVSA